MNAPPASDPEIGCHYQFAKVSSSGDDYTVAAIVTKDKLPPPPGLYPHSESFEEHIDALGKSLGPIYLNISSFTAGDATGGCKNGTPP